MALHLQLWETLKEAIQVYTGLSPATFFTVVALGLAVFYVVSGLFGSSDNQYQTTRNVEEKMEPLPPPVQLGEISEDELKAYDRSDPKKPLLMAIKAQIYDVSQSSESPWELSVSLSNMEDSDYTGKKWEDLDIDILVKIFQSFDIFELISGIAQVCSTWRFAACDPILWRTLDLSAMQSNYIRIPNEPYVYVDGRSDKTLTKVLKISLNLSRGNIITLIFHFYLYVSDEQLTYTAERCPQLKRLVMPAWNRIKKTGICTAVRTWKDLESLTMPSIANPPYLMEEIARNCKNFTELKIMGPCDVLFASTLAAFLPNLKVLSLRCSTLLKDALIILLEDLPHLEVLNISHCLLIEVPPPPGQKKVLRELDESILEKASRLREFLTCMSDSCIMCQRTRNDEGLMRWYKYEEGLWKADEVRSLAL